MVNTPLCECGQIQTIKHIAEKYSLTKYEGLHKGGIEVRNLEVCL